MYVQAESLEQELEEGEVSQRRQAELISRRAALYRKLGRYGVPLGYDQSVRWRSHYLLSLGVHHILLQVDRQFT